MPTVLISNCLNPKLSSLSLGPFTDPGQNQNEHGGELGKSTEFGQKLKLTMLSLIEIFQILGNVKMAMVSLRS